MIVEVVYTQGKKMWKYFPQFRFVKNRSWDKSLYSDSLLDMQSQEAVVKQEENWLIRRENIFEEVCNKADCFLASGAMDFFFSWDHLQREHIVYCTLG